MTHLAIDLGQTNSQSVAVYFDPDDRTKERVVRFKTTEKEIMRQMTRLPGLQTVIIEMCTPARWVYDLFRAHGIEVLVANTNDDVFRDAAKRRQKTDRDDAERLQNLYLLSRLKTVYMLSPHSSALRSLLEQRWRLRREATASKNAIKGLLNAQGVVIKTSGWSKKVLSRLRDVAHIPDASDITVENCWKHQLAVELDALESKEARIAALEQAIDQLTHDDKAIKSLRSAPGCGDLIAAAVVAALDDPHRFRRTKQVSKYSGLTPQLHQSGQTTRIGAISRRSWALLRAYLVQAVLAGIHRLKDPWLCEQYSRMCQQCGNKKKAIVAIARRYFVRLWQMLRRGCCWQDLDDQRRAAEAAG